MIPIGTEMIVAAPAITSVPMIACAAPPPAPITPRCVSVKNSGSKRATPFETTVQSSDASGITAIANAQLISTVMPRSVALRRPSTARDQP